MLKEFLAFLKEYGVIGLAIAVIVGGQLNELVKALVDGILMPLVTLVLPAGMAWQEWTIGVLLPGKVLAALLNFLIVAWLVFWFSKKVLREEQVAKK
ncbi:MAG TPA: MscL family protein [Gemmatimonadales bacterium]|jgi:large conductance mechanosensitive channel|nr:MscL family protein [Gemmatimonadales bacterium]